jgi:hypothetical protein
MSGSATQDQWLEKVVEQLRSREGVEYEALKGGRMALEISYNGASGTVILAGSASDFRAQKIQYGQIRKTLTDLGIKEGLKFVAAKRSRKPMSPEMLAARAKQQKEFDAWQEVWRTIRAAEKSLDVEFEISQMLDYY